MLNLHEYEYEDTLIYVRDAGYKKANGVYQFKKINFHDECSPIFTNLDHEEISFHFNKISNEWTINRKGINQTFCIYINRMSKNSKSFHEFPPISSSWISVDVCYYPIPQFRVVTLYKLWVVRRNLIKIVHFWINVNILWI